ncbi:MAG: TetR/AcrR family transcriptional regulator [Bacteroidales bacterium]|nr:TetR/AcrR family transcriptional regulator [Bacteroidales bacterium]
MNDCKNRIIEEAASMFRTYGIRAVTMDMLSSNLGISKRTLYENFRDKDELLITVLKCMEEKRKEVVESTLSGSENVIEAIFKLLRFSGDHFRNMSPAFYTDLRKYHHVIHESGICTIPDLTSSLRIVEQGISEGSFRNDLDAEIINRGMYGIFRFTGDMELFPASEFSRQAIVRNLYINFLRGICTEKGVALLDTYHNEADLTF